MKILILGIDGYIGWPLAQTLRRENEVTGIDSLIRRFRVESEGSDSLIPIRPIEDKKRAFRIELRPLDSIGVLDPDLDAIIHLAEQPSAPWSMRDKSSAIITQHSNMRGTLNLLWSMREHCPQAHLIKLGSMGEYGTPDCDIPEGFIEEGPMKGLTFPRSPGSFYHLSKVFDSYNIEFACKTWGLRATDIMQGIVFGHIPGTRFDYDECFGTVVNRFCVQAVADMPLTVYGSGGQTRGFLPLKDSIECIARVIENPPQEGEYRVFNQFAKTYSVYQVANSVARVGESFGMDVKLDVIDNPREEKEIHRYNPKHDKLAELGYRPNWDFGEELSKIINAIMPYKDKINKSVIRPKIKWKSESQMTEPLATDIPAL